MACFILKPILWNRLNYVKPSGVKAQSGFPAEHGFGHEEWNNSPRLALSDETGDYRVFHTEGVGSAPVGKNVGQTFVFMTASHGGLQQLVGIAGNATCLASSYDDINCRKDRDRIARRLNLFSLWKDAWEVSNVRKCYGEDREEFQKTWRNDLHWVPNWICPASFFWWPAKPVTLDPGKVTGKSKLLTMFASYTPLDLDAASRIMSMVPIAQRGIQWTRLVDAMRVAPKGPSAPNILSSGRKSITTRLTLAQARLGQGKFRDDLMEKWGSACAVSGLTCTGALRASHLKPWASCSDEERLNVNNGLLLSANLDALFDAGLITFGDDGRMEVSKELSHEERKQLGLPRNLRRAPDGGMRAFMRHHRRHIFEKI